MTIRTFFLNPLCRVLSPIWWGSKKKRNKWYLDNKCSRHMTGVYSWLSSFTKVENGRDVSLGDNSKGKIIRVGNVGKNSFIIIENVQLIIWRIACLVFVNYVINVIKLSLTNQNVLLRISGKTLFVRKRCINVYTIDIDCASSHDKYFSTLNDDSWLWHIILGYASMDLILKIFKHDLVKGFSKIGFQKAKVWMHVQIFFLIFKNF